MLLTDPYGPERTRADLVPLLHGLLHELDERSQTNYYVVMATPTSVRLTDEQIEALDEIAEREERSRSWLISKAVDEYIARAKKSRKTKN